jgi:uncharacterized membrane protein YdbT with pleckstrin-like domain
MKRFTAGTIWVVFLTASFAADAHAQDEMVTETPSAQTAELEDPVLQAKTYEQFRYESLQRSARRSRNALIGTSAALTVGTILAFSFAAACVDYNVPADSTRACSTAGQEAGLNIGAIMFMGGLIGTLTTGIMLGVRKGKLRRMDDKPRPGQAAVRWDPKRSRFVF